MTFQSLYRISMYVMLFLATLCVSLDASSDNLGADSAPGGSRNGSIGIGAYSTSRISRCSVFFGARRTTRSPGLDCISARASGDLQLM